jgi:NMD protein affecting ribosome stability and mRNA decay
MKAERGGFRMLRREQVMKEPIEDSYRPDAKLPDPARCPKCRATYLKGRWTWEKAPADAYVHRCPACQRINDHFPAGYVTLKGKFDPEFRVQVLNLVKTREARAASEHPLQRIMAVDDVADGIRVTTTDAHLASGIARALHEAFHGSVELKYSRDEHLVRAIWRPERP